MVAQSYDPMSKADAACIRRQTAANSPRAFRRMQADRLGESHIFRSCLDSFPIKAGDACSLRAWTAAAHVHFQILWCSVSAHFPHRRHKFDT